MASATLLSSLISSVPPPVPLPHRPVNGLDRLDQVRKGLIHRWQLRKPRRDHLPRLGLRIRAIVPLPPSESGVSNVKLAANTEARSGRRADRLTSAAPPPGHRSARDHRGPLYLG